MFPFRPRKPMLGGKLVQKRKAAAAARGADERAGDAGTLAPSMDAGGTDNGKKPAGPLDDLRGGGPLERAIRSDLGNLRELFYQDCRRREASAMHVDAPSGAETGDILQQQHDKAGCWYLLFKGAYRRGKFGIMHTRCMPNRIDRGDFAQMIYAACLGLFEDAVDRVGLSPNARVVSDAAFALFTLYTLYETCPLPEFPSLLATKGNAPEGTCTRPAGAVFSQQETRVLATLPLGLTAAGEQSRVIYRQSYKSPIRIGRADYARILFLQDLCLECKSKCECRRAEHVLVVKGASDAKVGGESSEDTRTSPSPAKTDRWTCQCGIANDCLEIIHRLQSKDSFDFCEYSGPCSVEGFAGSAEYFDKFVGAPSDIVQSFGASSVAMNEVLGNAQGAMLHENVASVLGIDGLGELYSAYDAALSNMQSANPGNCNQSNQARLIENTLRPLRRRRRWSAQDGSESDGKPNSAARLDAILDKVRSGKITSDDAAALLESSDDDEVEDAEPTRRSIWDKTGNGAGDEPLPVAAERDDRAVDSVRPQLRFKVPEKMSQSLQRGIQHALASVDDDLHTSLGQKLRPKEGVPITIGGGDARSFMPLGMFDLEDYDFEPNSDEDENEDVESVITHHTGHSVIPPTGAADALRDLLAFAKGDESDNEGGGGDDDGVVDGGNNDSNNGVNVDVDAGADAGAQVRKEKAKRKPARRRMQRQQDANDDDISMVSTPSTAGGGINALGSLLSKAQSASAKTMPRSKPSSLSSFKSKG